MGSSTHDRDEYLSQNLMDAQDGNAKAVQFIYESMDRYLYKVALNRCKQLRMPQQDAADIVQEVYVQLLSGKGTFTRTSCCPKQYLVGLVWNAATKHMRYRNRACPSGADSTATIHEVTTAPNQVIDSQRGPHDIVAEIDAAEFILRSATHTLVKAITMIYYQGMVVSRVSNCLSMSRFTLRRKLKSFFQKLRSSL